MAVRWKYQLGVTKGYEGIISSAGCCIDDEPAFAWLVPDVIKKRHRILSKAKSKYWQRTHKFGIRLPKTVAQAQAIDRENGDTLWWDAIVMEMKNIRPAMRSTKRKRAT